MTLNIDLDVVEETAKLLYIRALKILPDDIKLGFAKLTQSESDGTARTILATMRENIVVAERTNNLLCQDTGIPIYNVVIGRHAVLVSQSGVSGSSAIGDFAALGGQAGIAGHLTIGAGAQVAAAAGVMTDIPPGERWAGAPA